MKRIVFVYLYLFVVILFYSLFLGSTKVMAVSEEVMNSWNDKHENRIIEQWGPPDDSINLKEPELLQNNKLVKILVYYHFTSFTEPGKSQTIRIGKRWYTTHEPSIKRNFKYTLMFWVDEEGYIRKWSKRVQEL